MITLPPASAGFCFSLVRVLGFRSLRSLHSQALCCRLLRRLEEITHQFGEFFCEDFCGDSATVLSVTE